MSKKSFAVILMVLVLVAWGNLEAVKASDSKFKTYEIRRGETLSELAWVLGVSMRQLVDWNPAIFKQGIRNLQPGTVLKYKTAEQFEEEFLNSQDQIHEEIKDLKKSEVRIIREISNNGEKVKKENQETREEIREEGSATRRTVAETKRSVEKARSEIEDQGEKVREEIKDQGDQIEARLYQVNQNVSEIGNEMISQLEKTEKSLTEKIKSKDKRPDFGFFMIIGLAVGMIALLSIAVLSIYYLRRVDKKVDSVEQEGRDTELNPDKLRELEEVDLLPEGEEETEFQLRGYKFKVLMGYDSSRNRYYSLQLQPGTNLLKGYQRKNDAVKSIKGSLKNYLTDRENEDNKIKNAIERGKIKKIS
jgi:murein DD-endopeptidase MepM/ murein hydrolase activator NlpD